MWFQHPESLFSNLFLGTWTQLVGLVMLCSEKAGAKATLPTWTPKRCMTWQLQWNWETDRPCKETQLDVTSGHDPLPLWLNLRIRCCTLNTNENCTRPFEEFLQTNTALIFWQWTYICIYIPLLKASCFIFPVCVYHVLVITSITRSWFLTTQCHNFEIKTTS